MTLTLTILGCGSSGGVPRIGGHWGQCNPANPKNRRRRCSVLLRQTSVQGETRVLIDTSPDLREQMLDAGIGWIDGVLYTHEHADHTHGIDELRSFFLNLLPFKLLLLLPCHLLLLGLLWRRQHRRFDLGRCGINRCLARCWGWWRCFLSCLRCRCDFCCGTSDRGRCRGH